MAASGRYQVLAEDLSGDDPTLRTALYRWSQRVGAVPYTVWQSAFWGLRRSHQRVDEDDGGRGESGAERAARIRSLYEVIQRETVGEDYAERARVAPVSYTHLTLPTLCSV